MKRCAKDLLYEQVTCSIKRHEKNISELETIGGFEIWNVIEILENNKFMKLTNFKLENDNTIFLKFEKVLKNKQLVYLVVLISPKLKNNEPTFGLVIRYRSPLPHNVESIKRIVKDDMLFGEKDNYKKILDVMENIEELI